MAPKATAPSHLLLFPKPKTAVLGVIRIIRESRAFSKAQNRKIAGQRVGVTNASKGRFQRVPDPQKHENGGPKAVILIRKYSPSGLLRPRNSPSIPVSLQGLNKLINPPLQNVYEAA
jgi:hypothetical protein